MNTLAVTLLVFFAALALLVGLVFYARRRSWRAHQIQATVTRPPAASEEDQTESVPLDTTTVAGVLEEEFSNHPFGEAQETVDSISVAEAEALDVSPSTKVTLAPEDILEQEPSNNEEKQEGAIAEIAIPPKEETRAVAEASGEDKAGPDANTARPFVPPVLTGRVPDGRGGLRGPQSKHEEGSESVQRKRRVLRPEVVCWKAARRWFVGIEIPEEIQEYSGLTVAQNGTRVIQDDQGRWVLTQITGKVTVGWDEDDRPVEIDLGDKPYLLLKLTGANIGRGRFVRYASVGWFLVVVPDRWQREEEIPALPSSENVFLAGYRAHYFLLERENNQKIAFRTPDGESVIIPTRAPRFELMGTRLPDVTENIGPLFGEGPPRLRALHPNGWSDAGTIVVGQEGPGRGRWRIAFSPEPDQLEQEFPKDLSERCSGWYYVRFSGADDNPIESLDFRFVSDLKDIKIFPHSTLPGINGHLPTRVEFLHSMGCVVEPADSSATNLSVEYEDGRTSATIPPDPIWDKTRWLIQPRDGTQVEAEILVERVWWAIGEEGTEGMPNRWTDRPLNISRDLVTATSKYALYFRLPRPRWAKEIRTGFERWKGRAFPVEVAKREVTVPLSHFEGAREIEDRAHEYTLKLWMNDDANHDMAAVVAIFPATQTTRRRARPDVRRMRNYLKRLGRKTQDLSLRQMISGAREQWSASTPKSDAGPYRIETSCVIALAWENLRANGIKPIGHRKRWLRRFVGLVTNHPDTMQEIREKYEALKRSPTNASSRPKR